MKRICLSIATLAAAWSLSIASPATAQSLATASDVAAVKVTKADAKKVRLYSPVGTPVEVAILDLTGTVLYQGTLSARDARGTSLNLMNLPDGRYYVTVTNDSFWMSQGLTVRRDLVSVDAQNVTELIKPALTAYAKNKYEIVMPGVRDLTVSIYDRLNDLIFTKSFDKGEVHRFDLSSLPTGSYTFVYGPAQKQFTERVAIK